MRSARVLSSPAGEADRHSIMGKKTLSWWTPLALAGLSVASGTAASAANARQVLGVVDWGQYYQTTADPKLIEGAKLIQAIGARNIFIAMSSNLAGNYPGEDFGPGPILSLKDLAQTPDYGHMFNMPFNTYVIVAYAFSDWDTLGAQNLAAERQEIADLTAHLLKTYNGTGKRFILKNWEGDWAMSEYANHGANDPSYIPTPALLQKMKDWLNARHAGVVQGRAAAAQAGPISNVEVHDAAEFVFVRHAQQSLPCFLTAVVPNVQSDYVSYSSYESLASPTVSLAQGIASDLAFIKTLTPLNGHQRPLIVSEFGFKESDWGADTGNRTRIAAQAFIDNGVLLAMYWSVEDATSQTTMALVRPNGSHSPQWTALHAMLSAVTNPPGHQVRRRLSRAATLH